MSSYSIEGYLTVIKFRSDYTVLVEGKNDKLLISRIACEHQQHGRVNGNFVIDTAELIKSNDNTRGNRALVEFVHSKSCEEQLKLLAVVDREFRDFSTEKVFCDLLKKHKVVDPHLYWTLGHSVENYFFEAPYILQFIKHQFPNLVNAQVREHIQNYLPNIMKWACAISLSLRKANLLSRADNVGDRSLWHFPSDGSTNFSVESYSAELQSRGVTSSDINILAECIYKIKKAIDIDGNTEIFRWLTHGHVGWHLIWTAIAGLLEKELGPSEQIEQIERGYSDAKFRCACDSLAEKTLNERNAVLPDLWASLMRLDEDNT